jgi:hypothetical protein
MINHHKHHSDKHQIAKHKAHTSLTPPAPLSINAHSTDINPSIHQSIPVQSTNTQSRRLTRIHLPLKPIDTTHNTLHIRIAGITPSPGLCEAASSTFITGRHTSPSRSSPLRLRPPARYCTVFQKYPFPSRTSEIPARRASTPPNTTHSLTHSPLIPSLGLNHPSLQIPSCSRIPITSDQPSTIKILLGTPLSRSLPQMPELAPFVSFA